MLPSCYRHVTVTTYHIIYPSLHAGFDRDLDASANHGAAVAMGLVPCLAAWALPYVEEGVEGAIGDTVIQRHTPTVW